MNKTILATIVVAVLAIPTASQAGTLGCLLGAGAGGFGGSRIGSGSGQLAATAIGTLLGCGLGSGIQDRDQQRYQPQYQQPQYQPRYQPRLQSIQDYNRPSRYGQRRTHVGSVTPTYRTQPARIQWQQPRQQVAARSCPYSREYQSTVTVGGKQVAAYGTACSYDGGQNWDLGPLTPVR